jgi:hypothetical protein
VGNGAVVRIVEFSGSAFPAFDGTNHHVDSGTATATSGASNTPSTTTDLALGISMQANANFQQTVVTEAVGYTPILPSYVYAGTNDGAHYQSQVHCAYQILTGAAAQTYTIVLSHSISEGWTFVFLFKPGSAPGQVPYVGLFPGGAAETSVGLLLGSQGVRLYVPCFWYVRLTTTNATLGTATYY